MSVKKTVIAAEPAARPVEDFKVTWGLWAVLRLCEDPNIKTVLDIGAGAGEQTRLLRMFGKEVYTTDIHTLSDFPGDFMQIEFGRQFDAVLCSHVLEHQRNVGNFLDKMISLVPEGGSIAIAVPYHTQNAIVLGHLTVWSVNLLIYNLVQAGLNCEHGVFMQDNEITAVVKKEPIKPELLVGSDWDANDVGQEGVKTPWHDTLEVLDQLFPHKNNPGISDQQRNFAFNWSNSFNLPTPVEEVDIAVHTNKSEVPVMLRYDQLKTSAEQRGKQ